MSQDRMIGKSLLLFGGDKTGEKGGECLMRFLVASGTLLPSFSIENEETM